MLVVIVPRNHGGTQCRVDYEIMLDKISWNNFAILGSMFISLCFIMLTLPYTRIKESKNSTMDKIEPQHYIILNVVARYF